MSIAAVRKALTRNKFQSFLDAQPPRKHAGTVCQSNACPLSVYLGKQTTLKVSILPSSFNVDGKSKMLPLWAENFVSAVDQTKPEGNVTYGTCARILRNL